MAQLKGKALGEKLVLPAVMLRSSGDLFLDGYKREEVEEALLVPVCYCENDGASFLRALLS